MKPKNRREWRRWKCDGVFGDADDEPWFISHSDTYVEGIARERRRGIELQLKSPSSTRLTTLTYRTLNNNQLLPTLLTLHVWCYGSTDHRHPSNAAPRPPSFCLCRQCWHFSRLSPKASARKRVLIAPPAGWSAPQPHALSSTTRTGGGQNNVNTPRCGERKLHLNWSLREESEKSCNAAVTKHWDASKKNKYMWHVSNMHKCFSLNRSCCRKARCSDSEYNTKIKSEHVKTKRLNKVNSAKAQ